MWILQFESSSSGAWWISKTFTINCSDFKSIKSKLDHSFKETNISVLSKPMNHCKRCNEIRILNTSVSHYSFIHELFITPRCFRNSIFTIFKSSRYPNWSNHYVSLKPLFKFIKLILIVLHVIDFKLSISWTFNRFYNLEILRINFLCFL